MALFDRQTLKNKATQQYGTFAKSRSINSLNENIKQFSSSKSYDIFLSHSYLDADEIEILKEELEKGGYSVYVDWIEDNQLSRENVTAATAGLLRTRMKNCKSFIYAFSINSSKSKWMPWELGFFDGFNGSVSVLPITDQPTSGDSFAGTEFVGLYQYIVQTGSSIYVHKSPSSYVGYGRWLDGRKPT